MTRRRTDAFPGSSLRLARGLGLGILLLAWADAIAGDLTRADVVRLALAEHPAMHASTLRADAAHREAQAAGAYEPVMMEVGFAPASVTTRPGVQLSAGWGLPLWGMRGIARSAATSRAAMASAAAQMTRAELGARASIAVDDWLLATERLRVLDEYERTLVAVREAVSRRVAAGLALPVAEAMAQMSVIELKEQRVVAQRDLSEAAAALEAVAGVPGPDLAPDIAPLQAPTTAAASVPSPREGMASAEADMRADMAEMARREGRPMVAPMAALNTMWPDTMDWAMVGVAVGVPIDGGALRARRDAAAGEQFAAEAAREATRRDVERERAQAVAMLRMAEDMEQLMRTEGEPIALERARLARSAWESNQGTVGDWLDAERGVVEARWRIANARAERSSAVAMIAMIDGQPVPTEAP